MILSPDIVAPTRAHMPNRRWWHQEITLGRCLAGHLGDQLCLTPLPRLLTTVYKMCVYAGTAANSAAVFRHNPYVAGFRDEAGFYVDRWGRRGHGHLVHRLQKGFGLLMHGDPRPEVYLSDGEQRWAAEQRRGWPPGRPVCILSTKTVTERKHYRGVDWEGVGKAWMDSCTVVQPIITRPAVYHSQITSLSPDVKWQPETVVPGAVVYENLDVRQYMSLFSVADYFCGGLSGGAHVAAAFGLPCLIVLWHDILRQFPISADGFDPRAFCYPQHDYIAAEDLLCGRVIVAGLDETIRRVHEREVMPPASGLPAPAQIHYLGEAAGTDKGTEFRSRGDGGRLHSIADRARVFPGVSIVSRVAKRLVRTQRKRLICLPAVI
jgi:hypothetical protein